MGVGLVVGAKPTRLLGWLTAAVVAALVIAPLAALVPAAVIDRGPDGSVRTTLLYLALAVFDPFIWGCVWHSVTVAMLVALGSWLGGVALARAVGRWTFWGRRPLATLAMASLAVPPLFSAIGLRGLIARWGPWPGDAETWLAWTWAALAAGVPLVALAARTALTRIDPVWEDAARLSGASQRQVWRTVIWPIIRPDTARAVAAVFTLTLLEPGAPLVLGLRRTLSFQLVEAACGSGMAPRAASLALIAIGIAALSQVVVGWWGRSPWPEPPVAFVPYPRQASWLRSGFMSVALAAWIFVALLPTARLIGLAFGSAAAGSASEPGSLVQLSRLFRDDTELRRLAAHSLELGLVVGVVGLALAVGLARPASQRIVEKGFALRSMFAMPMDEYTVRLVSGRAVSALRSVIAWPEACPPLALAVGALMVPEVLRASADSLQGSPSPLQVGLRAVAGRLDTYRTPGLLLALALVAAHLPALRRAAALGLAQSRPILADAARTLGASRRRARRTLAALWLGSAPGAALVLTMALAATSLAPGLVLAPTSSAMPMSPGVLILADEPGALNRAAVMAVAAIALNLCAYTLASRRRAGALGAWFRG